MSRPDDTCGKTSTSATGGMGFKSQSDQILHLPTTCHRCNVGVWAQAQSRGDGHRSLMTTKTY